MEGEQYLLVTEVANPLLWDPMWGGIIGHLSAPSPAHARGRMSGCPLGGLCPTSGLSPLCWFSGKTVRQRAGPWSSSAPVCQLAFLFLLREGPGMVGGGWGWWALKCPEVSDGTLFCPAQERKLRKAVPTWWKLGGLGAVLG